MHIYILNLQGHCQAARENTPTFENVRPKKPKYAIDVWIEKRVDVGRCRGR